MTDRWSQRLWLVAFLLLCSVSTLQALRIAVDLGDSLSPTAPYAEANALREVDGFRAQGLWHDFGLGNVLFGHRFADEGFLGHPEDLARSVSLSGVYTHYPPGPEYLLYVAELIFGPNSIRLLRLLPIVIGWAAALYFGLSVRRRFGHGTGWLVMLACVALPPFHDANVSLHLFGYALALVLVELGLCLRQRNGWAVLALVGFLQGWLSFDYVFLVTLIPLALELAMQRIVPEQPARARTGLKRSFAAGAGFAAAHVLHLGQVAAYYGSLPHALADMGSAAAFRAGQTEAHGLLEHAQQGLWIVSWYALSPYPVSLPFYQPDAEYDYADFIFRFLGLTMAAWCVVGVIALGLARTAGGRRTGGRSPVAGWLTINLLGLAVCSVWMLAMQNHALVHIQVLYRHLFFWFFLALLFFAVRLAHWLPGGGGGPEGQNGPRA